VLGEYEQAEDVTRKRLFLETMERVLKDSNKIILEGANPAGVLPYLPLDQLQRPARPAQPRTDQTGQGAAASQLQQGQGAGQ
jgi:membrane protease subunit HflK